MNPDEDQQWGAHALRTQRRPESIRASALKTRATPHERSATYHAARHPARRASAAYGLVRIGLTGRYRHPRAARKSDNWDLVMARVTRRRSGIPFAVERREVSAAFVRLPLCDALELTKFASQHWALEKGRSPGRRERRQKRRLVQVAYVPIDARSGRDQRTKPQARSALVTLVDLERKRALHQLGPRPIPASMC